MSAVLRECDAPVTTPPVVLGIDAGGTKLHARWSTVEGATLHERILTDVRWGEASFDRRTDIIVDIATNTPGLTANAIGIGAHGCDSDAECHALQARIGSRVAMPVAVVNDAELLGHAIGDPLAVNVVLGTGSIVVRRHRGGTRYRGGWGWLFGDDGSAWGLVRNAVSALARDCDIDGHAEDPLAHALFERAAVGTVRDLVDVMQSRSASEWAAWAPLIFELESRSAAADRAISLAVSRTVELIGLAAEADENTPVVFGGGVVTHQPAYAKRLIAAVGTELGLPGVVLTAEPVHGAVELASSLLALRTP